MSALPNAALIRTLAAALLEVVSQAGEPEPPRPAAPPEAATPDGWRMFSDEEQAFVDALRASGPTTSEELALAALRRPLTPEMRTTLRGLKKRGVIELTQRNGVRLLE